MEKIVNSICNVFIDENFKSFNDVICEHYNDENINKIYDKVLVITDTNVYNYHLEELVNNIKSKYIYKYIIPDGEYSKSIDIYEEIINYCIRINLSRKSLIIALGGGVVGDLAGFIASTYMRGIDLVQVPTSILAQVDSSIGGKVGINLGNIKNIIGSFYQPKFTYINTNTLRTLPYEEFIGGIAEVIKYAIIYDYEFLDYLIENSEQILNKENEFLKYLVTKCASIKVDVVGKDEKEGSLRKILNFGHTFGHGVEKLCNISHGYAISIGMNMAFKLSLNENLITKNYYDKFIKACTKYELPLTFNLDEDIIKVLDIMKNDKKNSFSKINLVLPTSYGKVEIIDYIDDEKILDVIKECHNA